MEVDGHEEIVGPRRLVYGSELHGGRFAYETYLVEDRFAAAHRYCSRNIVEVVAKGDTAPDVCVQRKVDILGHYEGIGVGGYIVLLAHLLQGVGICTHPAD